MQNFGPKAIKAFTHMYRASISLGYVPTLWRHAKVVFIQKGGKTDSSEAKSYRPISLTSFLMKAMERCVSWFLDQEVEPKVPTSPHQHAYLRQKSTNSALISVVDKIESAIYRGEYALSISTDILGAFDNILFSSIEKAMIEKKYPKNIIFWYLFYLKNRSVTANLLGEIITRFPESGLPQGAVLSSKIWNAVFDGLLKFMDYRPVFPNTFADDKFFTII